VNDNGDCTDGRRDSDDNVWSVDGIDTRFDRSIWCRFFLSDVFVIRLLPKIIKIYLLKINKLIYTYV
jgi:hypothetical protein